MSGSFRTIFSFCRRGLATGAVVAGLLVGAGAEASGTPAKTLILPLEPCHGFSRSCSGRVRSPRLPEAVKAPQDPVMPAPTRLPDPPAATPSKLRLRVRHLSPDALGLDGLVTPERLLSALAYRISDGTPDVCHSGGQAEPCSRMILLVDGKRWRPDGILGFTRAAIPARWIRRVDVMENAPVTASVSGAHPREGDPGIADVILHRLRFSGEASVSAGVLEGGGGYSGSNAEDYNILLDAEDRNGDSFLFDFNYERLYGPWWYFPP